MPRAKAILQSQFPYNVSARCINREWFQIPMPVVWKIFCEELNQTSLEHKWVIYSFVLMSNHFHLIVSTPEANISQCMQGFMKNTSHRLTGEGNRINETFAGRHYKCILQHDNYFLNAYKYNYRNPVASGICNLVEQYPYSTLPGILNPGSLNIPVADSFLGKDRKSFLTWLNTPSDSEKAKIFRNGLRHSFFKSKKNRYKQPIITEYDLL